MWEAKIDAQARRKMWPKAALALLLGVAGSWFPGALAMAAGSLKLVALGDSITAGLGLKSEDAYPQRLQNLLVAQGHNVEISNAGVSGDTVSDGLDRLDWSVPDGTDGVIVALGANDMLQGVEPARTAAKLEKLVARLEARHVAVLLVGMKASSNFGAAFRTAFDQIFPDLAARHGIDLYPFLLQAVARHPELNQNDGIHPNAKGAELIAEGLLPGVVQLIERIGKR